MTDGPKRTQPDQSLVYVVLLNFNGWRDTLKCLNSLEDLAYDNYRVLVIDNASSNDSVAQMRKAYPEITLIENGKNLGFAGGCNAGIRAALADGAKYVWLLNNDTVVDPNALNALVARAEQDQKIGAVGSVLYYMDRPKQVCAWGGGRVNLWRGRSYHFAEGVPETQLQFISGASLLLPRPALQDVGLLDEQFFMYWEDADLAFRLRKAGWRLAIAERSVVWHKESSSIGKSGPRLDAYFTASTVRFVRKYSPVSPLSVFAAVVPPLLKRLVQGNVMCAWAVWRAARGALNEQVKRGAPGRIVSQPTSGRHKM